MNAKQSNIHISEFERNAIHTALVTSGYVDLAKLVTSDRQHTEEEQMYASLAMDYSDADLEVDEDTVVSLSDGGAFVSAWLWIPKPDSEAAA